MSEEYPPQENPVDTSRQVKQALSQRYHEFFNLAPDSYLITDLQGIICEANRAAQALLDLPLEDLAGKSITSVIAEEDREEFRSRQAQLQANSLTRDGALTPALVPPEWKARLQPQAGRVLGAALSVTTLPDSTGRPANLLWGLHEISDSRQELDRLRETGEDLDRRLTACLFQMQASEENCRLLTEQILDLDNREFKFRSIVEQSQDGIILADENGLINEWNWAAVKITGLDRVDVLGFPLWEVILQIVDDEDFIADFAHYQAIHQSPYTVDLQSSLDKLVETRIRLSDGTQRYIQMSFFGIRTENGYMSGSIARDITQRKQLELALQESSLQLESQKHFITRIIESIPSSLVVIDHSLRVVSANHNFLEKMHRDVQSVLGHKVEDVFPQVLLEYTRLSQRVHEVFHTGRAVDGGKVAYRAPNLPSRTYYYRLIPIYSSPHKTAEAGQVENVMILMDDVTEREQLGEEMRRIERHLASLVECANDLVISMDPHGQIITWNWAAEMTSGLKADQVKGHSWISVCVPEQQSPLNGILEKLAHGANVQHIEAGLLTADGEEVPIAWSCSPMNDDVGAVVGIVAVGRDLTENRQMQDQLIQSAKMASLGVMAGGIAHELRNPLGIISASAQLLQESPEDVQLRNQGLQKISIATQRASLIIENLLKFTRSEGVRMKREIDLHAMLDETLALLSPQITLQKVVLERKNLPDFPHVYGSQEMLQQVFINLILNACNSMSGGGTLTITVGTNAYQEVEIRFSDTGSGISPENISKIFDPFFTTMPVGKGVGLGLSISHSIIRQHHGTLEVQSQVGKGSTFIVRLPGRSGI